MTRPFFGLSVPRHERTVGSTVHGGGGNLGTSMSRTGMRLLAPAVSKRVHMESKFVRVGMVSLVFLIAGCGASEGYDEFPPAKNLAPPEDARISLDGAGEVTKLGVPRGAGVKQGLSNQSLGYNYDIGSSVGSPVLYSDTCGAFDEHTPTCGYSQSSDHSYRWTAPATGGYSFTTEGSSFDTILQLYDADGINPIACNDDSNGSTSSSVQAELSAGQSIVIAVEGAGAACGPFQLHVKGPRISSQPYVGRYWSFNSYAYTLLFMRHMNDLGYVGSVSSSLDRLDATFKVVNGLADPQCLSFEARNYPGRFLRHFGYRVVLNSFDGSALFRQDATFCVKRGLADLSYFSFESYNYPGRYIRHRNNELWVESGGGDPYAADATFKLVAPWAP